MSKNDSNTVKLTLDPQHLPPLSAQERAELEALAVLPDAQIDYSDAPHLPDALWTRAAQLPRAKRQITLRIDSDVLDFFKRTGKRYQSRMNAVLRAYVEAQNKAVARR